jgi:hypothetical protein
MKVDKLLVAAALVLAAGLLTIAGLRYFGLVGSLSAKAYLIVLAAVGVFYIKMFVQDLISDEPKFYRNGYDLCVMTLSTAMTSLAAELFSSGEGHEQRLILFWSILAAALIGTLLAARNTKYIEKHLKGQPEGFHSGLSFVLGMGLFITNIYALLKRV